MLSPFIAEWISLSYIIFFLYIIAYSYPPSSGSASSSSCLQMEITLGSVRFFTRSPVISILIFLMRLRHRHWVAFVTISSLCYKFLSMKRMLFARVDNFSKTVGVHVVPDIILISKVCEKNFGHMTHHVIEFHSLSSVLFTPLTSAYIAMTIDRIVFAVASFLHFFSERNLQWL